MVTRLDGMFEIQAVTMKQNKDLCLLLARSYRCTIAGGHFQVILSIHVLWQRIFLDERHGGSRGNYILTAIKTRSEVKSSSHLVLFNGTVLFLVSLQTVRLWSLFSCQTFETDVAMAIPYSGLHRTQLDVVGS